MHLRLSSVFMLLGCCLLVVVFLFCCYNCSYFFSDVVLSFDIHVQVVLSIMSVFALYFTISQYGGQSPRHTCST